MVTIWLFIKEFFIRLFSECKSHIIGISIAIEYITFTYICYYNFYDAFQIGTELLPLSLIFTAIILSLLSAVLITFIISLIIVGCYKAVRFIYEIVTYAYNNAIIKRNSERTTKKVIL